MDDYEYFKHLALKPYSKFTLTLMSAAARVAIKRFHNSTSGLVIGDTTPFPDEDAVREEASESPQDLIDHVDESWFECANTVSLLRCPIEGSRFAQSMWHLAHGGYIDRGVVGDYLQLLRPLSDDIDIALPRMLRNDQECISETEGLDRPIIVPFHHDYHWAFAVAYSDCIHWYDSAIDGPVPSHLARGARPVVDGWKGPLQNSPEDAGVLMLMGIKLILQRKPHMSQEAADELVQLFRTRIFAELLCNNTKPTATELANLDLEQAMEQGDFTSDPDQPDKIYAAVDGRVVPSDVEDTMDVTRSVAQATSSASTLMGLGSETSVATRNPPMLSTANPPTPEVPSLQPQHPANTARKRKPQSRATSVRAEGRVRKHIDDRKVILENLSDALHFKRSALISFEDDPFVLWALLRYSKTSGSLHRRFHAVLFHNMAKNNQRLKKVKGKKGQNCLRGDLNKRKFWKRISDVGVKHGLGPFVPLCAFPNDFSGYGLSATAQEPLVEEFENQLLEESNMLRVWLHDARELCEAILCGNTPISLFKIDQYDLQSESEIDNHQYRSYVRLDSTRDPSGKSIQCIPPNPSGYV